MDASYTIILFDWNLVKNVQNSNTSQDLSDLIFIHYNNLGSDLSMIQIEWFKNEFISIHPMPRHTAHTKTYNKFKSNLQLMHMQQVMSKLTASPTQKWKQKTKRNSALLRLIESSK